MLSGKSVRRLLACSWIAAVVGVVATVAGVPDGAVAVSAAAAVALQ